MNPLVAQRVRQIAKGIEDLKAELVLTREQLESMTEVRDEMQKKSWSQAKEMAVLKERVDELLALREDNERLAKQMEKLEERLRRVLGVVDTLEGEFRP